MPFPIGTLTVTATPDYNAMAANGPDEVIGHVDCHPPPLGRVERLNARTTFVERFGGSLQRGEVQRIVAAAGRPPIANPPTRANRVEVVDMILNNLGISPLRVDLSGIPEAWWRPAACFRATISLRVFYQRHTLRAVSSRPMTHGGEAYPAGDALADFEVLVPKAHRFYRSFEWNPRCCTGTPVTRADESTEIFEDDEWHDWEEYEPGKLRQKLVYLWTPENSCELPVLPEPEVEPEGEGD